MIPARVLALAAVLCFGVAPAAAQDATLERGHYLVTTIMACGNCHTPKDAQGRAIAAQELAGGGIGFDIPPFAGVAANITPDRETGIGTWSDDEIKRAITKGVRKDGSPMKPPMGYGFYANMTEGDLDAVVAYLRTVPAKE